MLHVGGGFYGILIFLTVKTMVGIESHPFSTSQKRVCGTLTCIKSETRYVGVCNGYHDTCYLRDELPT